jgi:GTP cyclohydrolase IA
MTATADVHAASRNGSAVVTDPADLAGALADAALGTLTMAADGSGPTVALEVRHVPEVRIEEATQAAGVFLKALGVDLGAEGMAETPARMAHAYSDLFSPRAFKATTFPNNEGYDELVLARAIPLLSVCEHHMLAFTGVAHVGYLPGDRLLGLSKLPRLVEHFARRPQMQERLTAQIANWLQEHLHPRGVGVVLDAQHTCVTHRGVQSVGGSAITRAFRGELLTDHTARAEFLALTGVSSVGHRPGAPF